MKKIIVFLLLISFLLPQTVFADGMIIPPPDQNITQAQQKALIIHQNGIEDLIISLEFGGDAQEFAWFLPVPQRPEIKKGDDAIFTKLAELTKPKKNLLEKLKGERSYYGAVPLLGEIGAGGSVEEKVQVIESKRVGILDVTVVQATQAADLESWLKENGYQVPGEVERVLYPYPKEENFFMPIPPQNSIINRTRQAFQEYLDDGWYFVAAKIATEFYQEFPQPSPFPIEPLPLQTLPDKEGKALGIEEEGSESVQLPSLPEYYPQPRYSQAHITPLHLTFKTDKIVYPMKITSLNNASPSVLLYVLADHKQIVVNYKYQYAKEIDEESEFIFKTNHADKIAGSDLMEWLPVAKNGYLTKLYASYISPDQMKEDLRFEKAKDDQSVNTGEMRKRDWLLFPFYLLIYGPLRIIDWLSGRHYDYYQPLTQLTPILTLIFVCFLGGLGILWVVLFYFLLSKARGRVKRAILYILQFPGVWVLVNLLSLILVIPWLVILLLLKVDSGVVLLHLLVKNNLGAVFFTAIFYALQSRVHLIFKKEKKYLPEV